MIQEAESHVQLIQQSIPKTKPGVSEAETTAKLRNDLAHWQAAPISAATLRILRQRAFQLRLRIVIAIVLGITIFVLECIGSIYYLLLLFCLVEVITIGVIIVDEIRITILRRHSGICGVIQAIKNPPDNFT